MRNEVIREYSSDCIHKAVYIRANVSQLAYERLRVIYPLPSLSTIKNYLKPMNFSEGVMPSVLQPLIAISERLWSSNPSHPSLQCILVADEMSIDGRVMYDPSNRSITGTVASDFLTSSQIEESTPITASKILVYMLKNIFSNQKQAVAWFFTSSLTKEMMKSSFLRVVAAIESKTKFSIHGLCTDQGGANEGLWSLYPETSMPHPVDDSRRLFFLIDISHLMKNLWNSLISTDIVITQEACSKISSFLNIPPFHGKLSCTHSLDYFISMQQSAEEVPIPVLALTHQLLHPKDTWAKMRVYPTEIIFSHKVASALVSFSQSFGSLEQKAYCKSMASFIKLIATFRDIATNCSSGNSSHHLTESHFTTFELVAHVFNSMKFFRAGKAHQKPKYPSGITRFTKSTIHLFQFLEAKHGIESLPLGELSSDYIENFFSRIKSQSGNPTPAQVSTRMKAVTLKTTDPVIPRNQNAQPKPSTSYITGKDIELIRPQSPPPNEPEFVESSSTTNTDHAIVFSISEELVTHFSQACPSCHQFFLENYQYPTSLKPLIRLIMNNIDINVMSLRNRKSVDSFIPWLIDICDLSNHPPFNVNCHSLQDIVVEIISSYFNTLEIRFEKSSLIYASKSSVVRSIASHK